MKTLKPADSTGELVALVAERSHAKNGVNGAHRDSRLEEVDRRSAQCYADMELAAYRMRKIAAALESESGDDADGVVEDEAENEDSLVVHLESVRKRTLI